MKKILIPLFIIILIIFVGFIIVKNNKNELPELNFDTLQVSDISIYGESIDLNINKSLEHDLELYNVDTHKKEALSTTKYINDGIRPEDIKEGSFNIIFDNKKLTYKDFDQSFISVPRNNQRYLISLKTDKDDNLVLSKEKTNKKTCDVIIDPGHGGEDGGTDSREILEKSFNLEEALLLKEDLENLGYEPCLTRNSNESLKRYGSDSRTARAIESGAKYLISLHNNSGENSHGYEIYTSYYSNTDFGKSVAKFTKEVQEPSNFELSQVDPENGLYKKEYEPDDDSEDYETDYYFIIREVAGHIMPSTQVEANMYADSTRGLETLLFEGAYISDDEDYEKLQSDKFKQDLMQAIANGFDDYINN
ncbi:MAG: N-acetylmuramoyl-L-alanine amidase [Mycoplasmatales bacterium]